MIIGIGSEQAPPAASDAALTPKRRTKTAGTKPAGAKNSRGKTKNPAGNWKRPEQVAVIKLDVDLSGDPRMRREVEKHYWAAFNLTRALQHDTQRLLDEYEALLPGFEGKPSELRAQVGLTMSAFEDRAKQHVEASKWIGRHLSKASAQHIADAVWQPVHRHLVPDASGKRFGRPHVGSRYEFDHVPGRAKSHTKPRAWETYRLVGSLTNHLKAYGTVATVEEGLALPSGMSVFEQPYGPMPTPRPPHTRPGAWWDYDGPLAVVFTRVGAPDLVLPVRLPEGAGRFARLVHFLADPTVWHKIDLNRVRDRKAPGGWRYAAHLLILGPGYASPTTRAIRAAAPTGRLAGIDGNVSNLSVVSIPDPAYTGPASAQGPQGLASSRITISPQQRERAEQVAAKARAARRALDRSRRNSNQAQYEQSASQRRRAKRRADAGLPERVVQVPKGPRVANSKGVPKQAYRRDDLSPAYRRQRADLAVLQRSASQAKHARAQQFALFLISLHGAAFVTEHVNMRSWAILWGKALSAFAPGMLMAALKTETRALGGHIHRAGTYQTALSQRCLCDRRVKKPLSERDHVCEDCGLDVDRDLFAAALAACVTFTDPDDPKTARLDSDLVAVLATYAKAQQEGLRRSSVTLTMSGRDASISASGVLLPTEEQPTPFTRPVHSRRRGQRRTTGSQDPLRVNS